MGSVRREGSPSYVRVSNFIGLFTDEEMKDWVKNGVPEWADKAMDYFMETAKKEYND